MVSIELIFQKVSHNLNFAKENRKKSLFKSPVKSLKAQFMYTFTGGENSQLIRLYSSRIGLYATLEN